MTEEDVFDVRAWCRPLRPPCQYLYFAKQHEGQVREVTYS